MKIRLPLVLTTNPSSSNTRGSPTTSLKPEGIVMPMEEAGFDASSDVTQDAGQYLLMPFANIRCIEGPPLPS